MDMNFIDNHFAQYLATNYTPEQLEITEKIIKDIEDQRADYVLSIVKKARRIQNGN